MRRVVLVAVGLVAALAAGLVIYWRRFPRAGTKWGNEVLNPWLVEHGWSGTGKSEIGTLEHFGRHTGTRHLTPVHPVPTAEGFRIVVPLGEQSQWALNVLAAGHCRLHLQDTVYELDEPVLVDPVDVREMPPLARWATARLGFKYLRLHVLASAPGALEPLGAKADIGGVLAAEPAAASPEAEPTAAG
jgi:hypothetical protein